MFVRAEHRDGVLLEQVRDACGVAEMVVIREGIEEGGQFGEDASGSSSP